jgi:hypothetical protein
MGRQHVGLGATVSRSLTVQVIETEIQMISNKFKTIQIYSIQKGPSQTLKI